MNVALSNVQLIITIFFIMLGTMFTRFLPVIIFSQRREVPNFVKQLQLLLPSAAIGLLVIYCFKDVNVFKGSRGLPELLAVLLIILLQRTLKNSLLSISGGTFFYMILIQKVF